MSEALMLKKEITAVLLAATFFLNLVAPVGAASIDDKQAESLKASDNSFTIKM